MARVAQRGGGGATGLKIALLVALFISLLALSLPGSVPLILVLWFWIGILLALWTAHVILTAVPEAVADEPRMILPSEQPEAIKQVMDVRVALERRGLRLFRGPLRGEPSDVFSTLRESFRGTSLPLLQEDEQLGCAIVLIDDSVGRDQRRRSTLRNWILFLATLITTTMAGAAQQGIDLVAHPERFMAGLPFSLGLMAILGVHELGHYFTAKRHGIDVTPPFFIPVPFALGTFGAFIKMRVPPHDRRSMFDVAVAGPLAGLVIAIPALYFGLLGSTVLPFPLPHDLQETSGTYTSLLLAFVAHLALGSAVNPSSAIMLSPLAFAGWLGLWITALNLMPIGSLDGGHMARAMFGSRIGKAISETTLWGLFLLALFVWPALLLWALIAFLLAGRGAPPMNDLTPVSGGRKVLGYATFLILLLILAPVAPFTSERPAEPAQPLPQSAPEPEMKRPVDPRLV